MKFLKIKSRLINCKMIFCSCLIVLIFNQANSQSIDLNNFDIRCSEINTECEEIEYSDLAYHPDRNMLFMPIDSRRYLMPNDDCNNTSTGAGHSMRAFDLNTNREYIVQISPYPSPRDFESLTYLENDFFALVEENERVVYFLQLSYSFNSITEIYSNMKMTVKKTIDLSNKIGISTANNSLGTDGVEGVTYNPSTNKIYFVTERDPIKLYEGDVSFSGNTPNAINLSNTSINLGGLFPQNDPHDTKDASAIYHLGQYYPAGHPLAERMLVLSDASGSNISDHGGRIFEINADGTLVNNKLAISEVAINEFQPEGINFVNGSIYIASEGDKDYNTVRSKLAKYSSPICNQDCTAGDIAQWNAGLCECEVTQTINGCTNSNACNYNSNANCDDGSCEYGNTACADPCNVPDPDDGCPLTTDSFNATTCTILNIPSCSPNATFNASDCSCIIKGCTDPCASNFNTDATEDDGSCTIYDTTCNTDCTVGIITQWNAATCSCEAAASTSGCTNPDANNYNNDAICDDGTCTFDIALNLKVYLDGPYISFVNSHSISLYQKGILPGMTLTGVGVPTPAGQPYNTAPWNYTGTEGSGFGDSDYIYTDVDWVLVSLRTKPSIDSTFFRVAGILESDGNIRFIEGSLDDVKLPSYQNEFYVVVEHRNHLPVMSPNLIAMANYELAFDFTTQNSWHTPESFGQLQISSNRWAAYPGNAYQGNNFSDSDDLTGADKTVWDSQNGVFSVYLTADFNLNGDINGADKSIWLLHNGISTRVSNPTIQ